MTCRLAPNVRVRKESWGLLFYSPAQHKICLVRSADWLTPRYFDGTWTVDGMVADIARRRKAHADAVERAVHKAASYLLKNGMIVDESC